MTSIKTNMSAMAGLQTLRATAASLAEQRSQVSSGLRVGKASDNVAYWSISTTMRSDRTAISAANDAMGLGAAKVDTAYAAMTSVLESLTEFKSKLVTANETSVDRSKIQGELDQLKKQVVAIADSASFNGENWLTTDVDDIFDPDINKVSVVSGFTRGTDGAVSVNRANYSLVQSSLFNSTGGGMLQADPRDLKTIGGLRFEYGNGLRSDYAMRSTSGTGPGTFMFDFSSPMTFGAGDSLSFDITIDEDNPADGIPPAYDPGRTTSAVIDAGVVNSVLGRSDGVIGNYKQYAQVLNNVLSGAGAFATTYRRLDPPNQTVIWVDVPNVVGIVRGGFGDKDGSSMSISNVSFTGVTQANQIADRSVAFGVRRSSMTLDFEPLTVYDDVIVSMRMDVDHASTSMSFDKDFVNLKLGKTNGKIETSNEMATVLTALVNRSDIIINAPDASTVSISIDPLQIRKSGEKSSIGFYGIDVNIEPLPTMNFLDIDIAANPRLLDGYVGYIEQALGRVTGGAAALGALQTRIEMQSQFAQKSLDTIDAGVSRLVDADMEEASARLSALQTQQQLAIQALQISNDSPKTLLSLFN
ncbi:putative flagellin [Agrobacterium rubi TR3 = NBRC 13261]|uniref:Flagellin n=1 Tax=Agrobacterium rubi TR3 = NBRC 13261 TaxID=1368415 RepID=A0A081CQ57_9HYPH|nr:flagellin [Agrobacterium rubi]MBP1877395.1 flagellin [Agrobacterium rubi]MCL6651573.1 hypothetical protein [Agrobacterium rubi]GAK68803.1 putative flagellin [Agrobacterium rubi TR3 = NBRC 13261]